MKNKIFKVCSVAVLLLITIFTLTACGNKGNDKEIATIEGFRIESVRIFHLREDSYNLEVGVTNTNDEVASFDFSQIILKLDGRIIEHNGDETEYGANKYFKWSFQIKSGHGLSVGDKVAVYYGEQKLKDIKVVEF